MLLLVQSDVVEVMAGIPVEVFLKRDELFLVPVEVREQVLPLELR